MKSKEELLRGLQEIASKYPQETHFDIVQAQSEVDFVAYTYTDSKGNPLTIWQRRVKTEHKV